VRRVVVERPTLRNARPKIAHLDNRPFDTHKCRPPSVVGSYSTWSLRGADADGASETSSDPLRVLR
jgi:hypothetical protein